MIKLNELADIIPYPLVVCVKDVGSVLMNIDTLNVFSVTVATYMGTLLQDENFVV